MTNTQDSLMERDGPVAADERLYARPRRRHPSLRTRSIRSAAARGPVAAAVTEKLGTADDVQWIDFIVAEPEKLYRIVGQRVYEFTEWLDAREYSDPFLAGLKKKFLEDKKRDRAGPDPYPVGSEGLRTPKFCTPAELLNEWARARGEPEKW